MNRQEHADNIQRTLKGVHDALDAHHAALAAAVVEHGRDIGLGNRTVAVAAMPKDPPPNPERATKD